MNEAAQQSALLVVTTKDWVKLRDLGVSAYSDPLSDVLKPDPYKVGVLKREMSSKEWIQIAFERLHLS